MGKKTALVIVYLLLFLDEIDGLQVHQETLYAQLAPDSHKFPKQHHCRDVWVAANPHQDLLVGSVDHLLHSHEPRHPVVDVEIELRRPSPNYFYFIETVNINLLDEFYKGSAPHYLAGFIGGVVFGVSHLGDDPYVDTGSLDYHLSLLFLVSAIGLGAG